mgnify:CR=1 FL=1
MSEWFESLDGIFAQLWTGLEQGVADRNAPARHPTIATVSVDGWPETRMVVLRAATRETGGLEVHTDITSAKVASLRAQPRAERREHVVNLPHVQGPVPVRVSLLDLLLNSGGV